MLDLSPEKILVLGILALVVLGPNRLPGAARSLGRFLGQVRSMSSSFQSEVRDALHEPAEVFGAAITELRPGGIRRSVRQAVTSTLIPPANGPAPLADGPAPGPAPAAAPGTTGPASTGPASTGPGWPAQPDDPALN